MHRQTERTAAIVRSMERREPFMKRRSICIGMLLMILCLLVACSGTSSDLRFTNHTDTRLDSIYISNGEDWGDPLNKYALSNNESLNLTLEKLGGPGTYDIGTINSDARCFDVFDVQLASGDKLELGEEYTENDIGYVKLTVTHADGTETTYTGYAYYESELDDYLG